MAAQLKYGEKRLSPDLAAKSGLGGDAGRSGLRGWAVPSSVFVGQCDGLKGYIFDYGAPGHPELYQKSKEAFLDYIRVEYEEGVAVAESILS